MNCTGKDPLNGTPSAGVVRSPIDEEEDLVTPEESTGVSSDDTPKETSKEIKSDIFDPEDDQGIHSIVGR